MGRETPGALNLFQGASGPILTASLVPTTLSLCKSVSYQFSTTSSRPLSTLFSAPHVWITESTPTVTTVLPSRRPLRGRLLVRLS